MAICPKCHHARGVECKKHWSGFLKLQPDAWTYCKCHNCGHKFKFRKKEEGE